MRAFHVSCNTDGAELVSCLLVALVLAACLLADMLCAPDTVPCPKAPASNDPETALYPAHVPPAAMHVDKHMNAKCGVCLGVGLPCPQQLPLRP